VKKDIDLLIDAIPYLTHIYDEPLQFSNSIQMYYLCSVAREHGIKVLISGEGADEIFCGYERYERTLLSIDELISRDYSLETILYYGGGLDNAELVSEVCSIASHDFDHAMLGESYSWLQTNSDIPLMDLMMLYDQYYRLQTINQRQDRMGMAASLELRHPYLNYELVNLANSLHISLKFDALSREGKYTLRRIAGNYNIPSKIITRKKAGFPTDVDTWVRSKESEKRLLGLINHKDSITKNYLDFNVVRLLLDAHYNSAAEKYDVLVQRLFYLEVWKMSNLE